MTDDQNNSWNQKSGSFIKRPGKGWLHTDDKILQEGVTYNVKFVGCLQVHESMKSLSFETRTLVARESIRRVAEAARFTSLPRRCKKNDENLNRILSSPPEIPQSSMQNIALHINIQYLKASLLDCDESLFQHMMQNISFACGGDTDIQDFVAYVAKDDRKGRACYVFECTNGLASNVITTIGQAFELRFKKFLNNIPNAPTISSQPVPHPPPPPPPPLPVSSSNVPNQSQKQISPKAPCLDDNIQNMPWYHSFLSRIDAEKLLVRDGDYLVRKSNRAEDQYVLSGRYQSECRHIFLVDPNGAVRTKDKEFQSICHLIQYHESNGIPIVSKDNELLLVHAIQRK